MPHALAFVAAGAVLVVAGTALARFADALAERTRLGGLWTGAVLLAGATSLPELGTDLAAVRMGALDLAVGDLFGSSMANMLILALVDLLPPRGQVLRRAALDHTLSGSLALSLNALAAVLILAPTGWVVGNVAPESVLLAGIYLFGTRAVYRHAMREWGPGTEAPSPARSPSEASTLRRPAVGFGLAALVVLLVSPVFAGSAKGLAEATGLGTTFVGTWLVGASTSLPELVASVAAVRLGAYDLAVGNLFGSNAFNISILLWLDLAEPGSLFVQASRAHAVSGLFAVVLMSLGLAAIVYRAKKRFAVLEPDSALIVITYVLALVALYRQR